MHRPTLGILAVLFFCGGLALYFWQPEGSNYSGIAGMAVRIGAVLGTLCLAHRHLSHLPRFLFVAVLVIAVVLALRRHFAPIASIMIIAIMMLRPRGAGSSE